MTSFKTYLLIAKKHMGLSVMYLAIFFGITMMLVANAREIGVDSFQSEKVDIAVYDKDNTTLSKALYQYLEEHQNLVELEEDEDTWRDAMYIHDVEYILIIPEGFEERMQNGGGTETLTAYETPGTQYSMFVEMKLEQFLKTYQTYAGLGKTPEDCYRLTLETLEEHVEVSLKDKESTDELPASYYYFKYVAYVLPCMMLLSVSPCIKAFKRKEIAKRTFCSSSSGVQRNLELTLGTMVHGLGLIAVILVVGIFYCEKMTMIQYLLNAGNVLVHALAGLGLAFAVANLEFNQNLTSMFANIYALASAFLCGVFVPREYMTDVVKGIGHIFPAYWYVNLQELVVSWNGSSARISTAAMAILVQLGFAAAYLCVGFVAEKQKKM